MANRYRGEIFKAMLLVSTALPAAGAHALAITDWQTVVNNSDAAPQSTPQGSTDYFFSYNQPAVNDQGQVVFRARAKPISGGGGGEPVRGIYTRDMSTPGQPINIVADNLGVLVPTPNTTAATFTEFPSTPRIDATSAMVATRAQSQPVYILPDGTKTGTSGIYTNPGGILLTGASQLGDVVGLGYYQVPGAAPGTGFDQFPGSPSPTGGNTIVFKGNYTEGGVGKTGVFYRNVLADGGAAPVQGIAQTGTPIPGSSATFGSTAPPSAANGRMVFTGFDNEAAPTAGGIYMAPLSPYPTLTPIVSIGGAVPSVAGANFTGFGEGLSYDGHYVAFWGSWGTQTMTVHKSCVSDGNAAVLAYCNLQYPTGADLVEPLHQGIFSADSFTGVVSLIAQTGDQGFTDFLYWTYSGKPPGAGDAGSDAEPPRWRASSFVATDSGDVAFKGQKSGVDGLYLQSAAGGPLTTLLDTTMSGQLVDPMAPAGSLISSIGIERDGFRNHHLTITAGMLNSATTESWAGVYMADVPEPMTITLLGSGALLLAAARRRRQAG